MPRRTTTANTTDTESTNTNRVALHLPLVARLFVRLRLPHPCPRARRAVRPTTTSPTGKAFLLTGTFPYSARVTSATSHFS